MHVKTGGTRTEANRHMTVEQTDRGNGRVNDIGALERSLVPAPRDMRRKRPPLLSFLLRLHTLRRVARVISLLTLDYMGVVGALFTALIVKTMIRGNLDPEAAWRQTRSWVAFAYLVTVLMFARVELYADRPRRAGLTNVASALFQVTIVSLVFALASGEQFSSYYIFYGSLFFGIVYIATLRALHLQITGWLLEQAGFKQVTIRKFLNGAVCMHVAEKTNA